MKLANLLEWQAWSKPKEFTRKENSMKLLRFALIALVLSAAAYPQTSDLGMGTFSSENGAILMTLDASLVNRIADSPYVMFFAFLGSKDQGQAVTVAAKDVIMVYKGQEYAMPTVKELRANYRGGIRDLDLYRRLGKEAVAASWVRMYQFPEEANFFPTLTQSAGLPADEGHMIGYLGFLTPLYFKNPGFAKGDRLTIKVRDKKNPELAGECEVILN
jgi:hypothetical protein